MTLTFVFGPISAIFLLGMVTSGLLTLIALKRRPAPGASTFALFNAVAFLWSTTCLLEYASPDILQKLLWARIQCLAVLSSGVLWLLFTLEYTGHHFWRKPANLLLLILIPLVTMVIVLTNQWHSWYWTKIYFVETLLGRMAIWEHGFWFWISALYQYCLVVISAFILVRSNPDKSHLKHKQILILLLGASVPLTLNCLYLFNIKALEGLDFTAISICLSSILYAISIFRYHLLDVNALARNVMVEKIPEGILVLDSSQKISDVNQAAERIAGCDISKGKGEKIDEVWPEINKMKSAIQPFQKKVIPFEKNGQKLFLDVNITPITDEQGNRGGELILLQDVTDITLTQFALKRKLEIEEIVHKISARFIGNFDIEKDISASLSDIGILCRASRSYLFMINKEKNEMSNTHEWCREGVSPQIDNLQQLPCATFPWWIEKLEKDEIVNIPEVNQLPAEASAEKEILSLQEINSVLVFPVKIKGDLAGFIGLDDVIGTSHWTEEDISILRTAVDIISASLERYQADQQIRILFNEEKKERQELEKEMLARANFISVLTHELKTPLTPVMSSIELLSFQLESNPNSIENKLAKNALNGVNSLSDRLDELLELAKLTNGTTLFNFHEMNGRDFLEEASIHLSRILKKQNQTFITEINSDLPVIKIDPILIKKSLTHILLHSSRACGAGDNIKLKAREEAESIIIEIEDTGEAISKEEQNRLCEPYHRVDQDGHRTTGMGLGMAIAHQIIKAHNGSLQIQNAEYQGNLFRLKLPIFKTASKSYLDTQKSVHA
jgi:PAS domain S-box-containing protein